MAAPAGQTVTLTGQSKELFISCSHCNLRGGGGEKVGGGVMFCPTQTSRPMILLTLASGSFHSCPVQYGDSQVPYQSMYYLNVLKVKIHFPSHTCHVFQSQKPHKTRSYWIEHCRIEAFHHSRKFCWTVCSKLQGLSLDYVPVDCWWGRGENLGGQRRIQISCENGGRIPPKAICKNLRPAHLTQGHWDVTSLSVRSSIESSIQVRPWAFWPQEPSHMCTTPFLMRLELAKLGRNNALFSIVVEVNSSWKEWKLRCQWG